MCVERCVRRMCVCVDKEECGVCACLVSFVHSCEDGTKNKVQQVAMFARRVDHKISQSRVNITNR